MQKEPQNDLDQWGTHTLVCPAREAPENLKPERCQLWACQGCRNTLPRASGLEPWTCVLSVVRDPRATFPTEAWGWEPAVGGQASLSSWWPLAFWACGRSRASHCLPCVPLPRTCDLGPSLITQGDLLLSRSITTSAKILSLSKAAFTGSRD